ncbi:hypothetical protein U5640_21505 [Streptomyces sp. SS7]|uniref:hypothetical protein n=1 Tax=Streptomyces sp. SS7 TaxID=3108485 RepID=UPI0030EE3D9D
MSLPSTLWLLLGPVIPALWIAALFVRGRGQSRRFQGQTIALLGPLLLSLAWLTTTTTLAASPDPAGPDAYVRQPPAIMAIIALLTAVISAVGVVGNLWIKLVRTRGEIDVQKRLADNDHIRAQAQMELARRGIEVPAEGDGNGAPASARQDEPEI